MNFCKKTALFVIAALSSLNAAPDNAISKAGLSAPIPTFYEDQMTRQRDLSIMNPITLESPVDSSYVIGPGDFFEILLPNGNEGLQVSPEGTVAIHGCGLVDVGGLKLSEAKRKILEKLKNRYDQRYTGVHLVQLRRFAVNVQGAVTNPGQFVVNGQARAREAIYLAGNFKFAANKDSLYIYRDGDTIATTENIHLQNGDIIEVPYKEWQQTIDLIYAEKIITVPYVPNKTIKEYIEDAGMSLDKNYNEVSIRFPEDNFTRWISVNQIDKIFPEPLNKIEFHIKAPFVYVGGAVAAVGKVPYNASMHAADYVAASGVTVVTGNFSRISVLRNGKRISVDWAKGEILPGDFIDIPRTNYELVKDATYFIASLIGIASTAFTIYILAR